MRKDSIISGEELLRRYLSEPVRSGESYLLDELIEEHALPVIRRAVRSKFRAFENNASDTGTFDFEDICEKATLAVIERLASIKTSSDIPQITDFQAYVSTVAINSWNQFLNQQSPRRRSLKNKIRYATEKSLEIAVWTAGDVMYCGLAGGDRERRPVLVDEIIGRCEVEFAGFRQAALGELIVEILKIAGSPVILNDVVTIVARLWNIQDRREVGLDAVGELRSLAKSPPSELEMREQLEQLWREICVLPVNQRIALLYNLRDEDGREMLLMFFNMRIATLREIGEAMNLSVSECAGVFPFLPMDDKTIAERMNLTPKQVSNLRKVARESLKRRLAGKPKREKRRGGEEA